MQKYDEKSGAGPQWLDETPRMAWPDATSALGASEALRSAERRGR